jgi:hypothetical protein
MVVALEVALAVALVAVAAAFLGVVFGRVAERWLVALAALLFGLACAAGVLVAVGAAIDRWDLGELAVVAGGFLASAAAVAGALGLSRGLARSRSFDELGADLRDQLDEMLARHAEQRAEELSHTLARERAETSHLIAEQERQLREEARLEVVQSVEAVRAELTEGVSETQRRLEQRLSSWSSDLERAQQQLKARLETLIRQQADALQAHEARLGAHAAEVEALEEHQRAAMARIQDELERAVAEALETTKGEIETHAVERRRALHEVGERLRSRERSMREQIEREEGELRQQLTAALAEVERRHLEQLERALDRSVVRLQEDAERTFDRQLREAREKTAERLSRELELAMEHFLKAAETEVVNRIADSAQASAARFQRQIDDLVRAAEVQAGISNERVVALSERLERSLEAAHDRLNAFESHVELELTTKLEEIERAFRTAGAAAERAQPRG